MLRFGRLAGGGCGTSEGGNHSRELQQDSVCRVVLIVVIIAIIVRVTIQRATRGAARRTSRRAGRGDGGPLAVQGMGWGVAMCIVAFQGDIVNVDG